MRYVQGFVAAVPEANREAFVAHATRAAEMFKKHGALAIRECWGEDVPEGELTSFPRAVHLEPGETVVFSWIEWPDKQTAEACMATMETDPGWKEVENMPFDGKRLIWGGFAPVVVL